MSCPGSVNATARARDINIRFDTDCKRCSPCCCKGRFADPDTPVYVDSEGNAVRWKTEKSGTEATEQRQAAQRSLRNMSDVVDEISRHEHINPERLRERVYRVIGSSDGNTPLTLEQIERINVVLHRSRQAAGAIRALESAARPPRSPRAHPA